MVSRGEGESDARAVTRGKMAKRGSEKARENSRKVTNYKPFIGFWQLRKAGLNKHTGKSCIHKITSLGDDLVQIE